MDRVKSGISGFDELVNGGFIRVSTVLVSGASGTGKTIFGMQYIYSGAADYKEPGIFVTVETNEKNIEWDMQSFNWDIGTMQKKNLMRIYRLKLGCAQDKRIIEDKIKEELSIISKMIKQMGTKRIVIDSTTAFGIWMDPAVLRSALFEFTDGLKKFGCTTVLTSEIKNVKTQFSAFGVEEFVSDGLVLLYFTPPHRSIFVRKLRGTSHDKAVHPVEIGSRGFAVKPKETVLWEAVK